MARQRQARAACCQPRQQDNKSTCLLSGVSRVDVERVWANLIRPPSRLTGAASGPLQDRWCWAPPGPGPPSWGLGVLRTVVWSPEWDPPAGPVCAAVEGRGAVSRGWGGSAEGLALVAPGWGAGGWPRSLQVSLQDETAAIVPKAGPSALKFVRCRSSLFFHGFSPDLPRCLYGYLMQ